jgi:hypothetical protein
MFRTISKYAARHGLVRVIGGRAVPALLAWDILMLANRTRRNPYVDRALRKGFAAARDKARATAEARSRKRAERVRRRTAR